MLISNQTTCAICKYTSSKQAALLFDEVCVLIIIENLQDVQKSEFLKQSDVPKFVFCTLASLHTPAKKISRFLKGIDEQKFHSQLKKIKGVEKIVYIPVMNDKNDPFFEIGHGNIAALEAIATNLPMIDTNKTTWEQIEDFRNDRKCLRMYREFRMWFGSLSVKSKAESIDTMNKKLDDYKFTIRKHGFETVQGVLSIFWNPKKITSLGSIIGGASLLGGEFYAALTSGFLVGSEVTFQISKYMINQEAIKRGAGAEIAILYEIEKKFG